MGTPLAIYANDAEHGNWRWQAKNTYRELARLESALRLTEEERAGIIRAVDSGFALAITPYYLGLADPDDPTCPIRRQVIPVAAEGESVEGDLRDPLGEEAHEVAPELVQRYPDRALLLVSDRCAVYCRFCTRSRMVGDGGGPRSMAKLEQAFHYIETHPEIQDVIVSGGDPLVMSTSRLVPILQRLATIDHVLTVRLATRAPVTIPQRIDEELCRALRDAHPALWVMTHFNHPKELTPEASKAVGLLVDHGMPVMNQSVLLRGINDSAETLEALFRGLVKRRVRPYYLLQTDPVRGTAHLRTPLMAGVRIMEQLQGRLSGIALPKLICDSPGGLGKVPIGPHGIVSRDGGTTTLKTFRGDLVDYIDPPTPPHTTPYFK